MWVLFVFIFLVFPNTRVKLASALIGGLVAGVVFQLIQGGYLHAQLLLSRYNAIYGSFAALPLFLIWMQLSWMIVLFGAQLAYAHQYEGYHAMTMDYERISPNLRKKYDLYIFWAIAQRFKSGAPPLTPIDCAQQLDLHPGLVSRAIENLLRCGLISAVVDGKNDDLGYQPAKDIGVVTLSDVLRALDRAGEDGLPEGSRPDLVRISDAVEALMDHSCHSSANRFIRDM